MDFLFYQDETFYHFPKSRRFFLNFHIITIQNEIQFRLSQLSKMWENWTIQFRRNEIPISSIFLYIYISYTFTSLTIISISLWWENSSINWTSKWCTRNGISNFVNRWTRKVEKKKENSRISCRVINPNIHYNRKSSESCSVTKKNVILFHKWYTYKEVLVIILCENE